MSERRPVWKMKRFWLVGTWLLIMMTGSSPWSPYTPFQQAFWLMLFGWALHMGKVAQTAVLNWDMLIGATGAFLLGVWGLHRALRWGKETGLVAKQWTGKHSLAVTVLTCLLFGFSIAAVGIVEHVRWLGKEKMYRSSRSFRAVPINKLKELYSMMLDRVESGRELSQSLDSFLRFHESDEGEVLHDYFYSSGSVEVHGHYPEHLTSFMKGEPSVQPVPLVILYHASHRSWSVLYTDGAVSYRQYDELQQELASH